MGIMIKARCPCGFESPVIPAGSGFATHMTLLGAPCYCPYCREMTGANYLKKESKCLVCAGELTFYNDPSLQSPAGQDRNKAPVFEWGTFILPDVTYLCPSCGKMTMRFVEAGCWD